jgi:WD40 repeat protein
MTGVMALCAPAAGAVDSLVLDQEQSAAHDGEAVRAVGFAGDGAGGEWIVSGGEDAKLRSWTLQLGETRVDSLDHTIYDLESSRDGSIVVTGEGGWNGGTATDTLRVWSGDGLEAGTGAPIGYVYVVALSADERWTLASGFYGEILVYETIGLQLHATQATGKKRTKAVAFSPDGGVLAATWKGGAIQLRSFPDDCAPQACELDLLPVSMSHSGSWDLSLAFWPHSTSAETRIVSGSDSGDVKVWTIENLADAEPSVSVVSVDSGAVRSLAWSPDGSMIAAGGDRDITVYDADTLAVLFHETDAHAGRVNDLAFSADSSQIASAGNDGSLKLWQALPAGCSESADCDDSNDCTIDVCVAGVCESTALSDDSSCNGGIGICCGGSCETAVCISDADCDDGDTCSTGTCSNGGTCGAACENTFPACGPIDACCGPLCDEGSDTDCGCVPTHSKEKGPRCRDGIDNDCDGLVDAADPDC